MTLRLFAAIAPSDAARDRLCGLQAGLPEGRVVAWENFHVTLAFFGEVDARAAEEIHLALAALDAPGFELWFEGTGAFGGAKPRALIAELRAEPALTHLHEKVEQAARACGLAMPARRFHPHATLKRLKPGEMSQGRIARWLEAGAGFLHGPEPVDAFSLFRSDLGRAGPIYRELARYPLSPRPPSG